MLAIVSIVKAAPSTIDNHIKIDQFGYRCSDQKIAVISNPQTGYNSGSPFTPGTAANQYQVRRWSDDFVAFTGTIVSWNGGATHTQSGDKIWWFDFSAFNTPGTYYLYDLANNVGSYKFDINDQVYLDVLKQTVRSYYYQRCGTAKTSANAGAAWTDAACHLGTQQDTDCRLYSNTSSTTSKNLSGGWHDAGDYNKYVNFTWETLTDLLLAYEQNPSIWADNYNIPESGNSIPDLLDEVKYELDWLLKMQQSDGSVLSIVGNTCSGGGGSPPSSDNTHRVYGPANTSAALTVSSVFALAAKQYNAAGMTAYATTLTNASINSWNWAVANPSVTWYNNTSGTCNIVSGEQETDAYGRLSRQLGAACFLYSLTGTAAYKTYFESNYTQAHLIAWPYAYPFEATIQDILLYYAALPGATAAVSTNIKNAYSSQLTTTGNADNLKSFTTQTDAYRAYLKDANYTWGSNSIKGKQGNMFGNMVNYNLDAANATNYANAASGYVHYIHGVNPNAYVFLSNMGAFGAENSLTSFYHSWFTDGSALWDQVGVSTYGPAPGYLPGGPNPGWTLDGCCPSGCGSAAANAMCITMTPPSGQPTQKFYKDWNGNWPQDSWSLTENGIYYQASYIRLLSRFIGTGVCGVPLSLNVVSPADNINSFRNNQIKIYPNPFDHHTTVEVISESQKKIEVRILSVLGKEIISSQEYNTNEAIEYGDQLKEGVFILEVKDAESIRTVRMIKN